MHNSRITHERIVYANGIGMRILGYLIATRDVEQKDKIFSFISKYLSPNDFITEDMITIADYAFAMQRDEKYLNLENLALEIIDDGKGHKLASKLSEIIDVMWEGEQTVAQMCKLLQKESQAIKIDKIYRRANHRIGRGESPAKVSKETEEEIEMLLSGYNTEEVGTWDDCDAMAYLKEINEREGLLGTPTGWKNFDYHKQGLQAPHFIIIGGRPAMGKTSFMCCMAVQAILLGRKVRIFSLEMSKMEMTLRLQQIMSNIPLRLFTDRQAETIHFDKMKEAFKLIKESNLVIYDTYSDFDEIILKIEQDDPDEVFIDYLQIMQYSGKSGSNRNEDVGHMTTKIKATCKKVNCCIVAGSQLKRVGDGAVVRRPNMSDARESGSIEQDADRMFFIHRPEYYMQGEEIPEEARGLAEILCVKDRHGPMMIFKFRWIGKLTKFQEWDTAIPDSLDDLPFSLDKKDDNDDIKKTKPLKEDEDLPF